MRRKSGSNLPPDGASLYEVCSCDFAHLYDTHNTVMTLFIIIRRRRKFIMHT